MFEHGDKVWIGRSAPRAGVVASIACDAATLKYRLAGTSDYWVASLPGGSETVASESMMSKA